ncbi:MAG: hypothetical protein ACYCYP_03050 [Leptospirales bacterium]
MLVKESSFTSGKLFPGGDELETPESVSVREKKLELENLFWWDLHHMGIHPRSVELERDRVRVSDGQVDARIPIGVLASGLSVLANDEGKRLFLLGRPFVRQIGYIARKGRAGASR